MACALLKLLALSFLIPTILPAQQSKDDAWAPVKFLLGDWIGEGGGQPGQGAGGFSFHPDLQGKILVRKNYADYPATKDRPAYRHDDLMIVYRESGDQDLRAVFFDNEGHVIHYSVPAGDGGNSVQFLSEVSAKRPRFRLTYVKTGDDRLSLKFEIAPPGQPDAFATYIEAKARRTGR
jgi:hypothetical protein